MTEGAEERPKPTNQPNELLVATQPASHVSWLAELIRIAIAVVIFLSRPVIGRIS